MFGRKDERGAARDGLFAEEEKFKEQEDWNLLYVAATRAKRILIVSGVAGVKKANAAGVVDGSWYARLSALPERQVAPSDALPSGAIEARFTLPIYAPPLLPPSATEVAPPQSAEIDEGILLHALMERLSDGRAWPIRVPQDSAIAQWLNCSHEVAAVIGAQARAILSTPELERYFNPRLHLAAYNEFEIAVDGNFYRYDRLVKFDAEIWILDYKRQLLDSERAAYRAQLARYRQAAESVFADTPIRTALVTVDGGFWEF